MSEQALDFTLSRLGPPTLSSPLRGVQFVDDADRLLYHAGLEEVRRALETGGELPSFVRAGPRSQLFFAGPDTKMGIVTCGGLCPGLNDVIRAVVLSAHYHYGVNTVYGFRYGYQGLNPAYGHEPLRLTPAVVDSIGEFGGTILGSSRGPQEIGVMVDTLEQLDVSILFTVGGDGTLRGAHALAEEMARRGRPLAIIGIPKTIDNDIAYIGQSFGFQTAAEMAHAAIASANTEANGAPNGVGLVKLMGRESGFIAAYTALVDSMVNFCLVPEVPFRLEKLLPVIEERLRRRGHAVIAVAEGAGQGLFEDDLGWDRSGNAKLGDIGLLLRDRIVAHFRQTDLELNLKYIDPSYMIRSVPANAMDSAFCLLLGHNAVHAAMAGFTDTVVGYWRGEFTLVPISAAVSHRRRIDPNGWFWNSVLASTGQPYDLS